MTRSWNAAIAILAVCMTACSDGGTGPTENAPRFTAELGAYAPYQVALLTLNGSAPATDVQGTLGGAAVTLMAAGDSSVAFMVPDVSGAQLLEFAVDGRAYAGTISVTTVPPVQDPEAYLAAFASSAAADIEAVAAGIGEEVSAEAAVSALELLQVARDSLAVFESRMAGLSPAEAQQVADILRANLAAVELSQQRALAAGVVHATAYGQIPQKCSQQNTALKKYKCTWDEFILAMADATIGLAGGALAYKVLAPAPWLAAIVGTALVVDGAIDGARAFGIGFDLLRIHAMIAAEIGKAVGDLVWEGGTQFFRTYIYDYDPQAVGAGFALGSTGMPPASMTSFTNGAAATFAFAPQVRPVRAADRALGLDWLAEGLGVIARYNRLIARFGTKYQLSFAGAATSYTPDVPHEEIEVEIVQNDRVRVRSSSGNGSLNTVVFETDHTGDQDFTYDIVYRSGVYPELRVRYEARLHQPTYVLGTLTDTTVIGDTIEMYGRVRNTYFLMYDDGTLAPNEGYMIMNTSELPAGVTFMAAGNGGHYVHLDGYLQQGTSVADTFDIRIMNYNFSDDHLLDATVIMHDSAGLYHSALTGSWTRTTYRIPWDGGADQLMHSLAFRFDADGNGMIESETYYSSNEPPVTIMRNEPLTWWVDILLEEGRPVHRLRYDAESGAGFVRLPGYPLTRFERIWDYGSTRHRDVWTKD